MRADRSRRSMPAAGKLVQLVLAALLLSLLYPGGTILLAKMGVLRMPVPDSVFLPGEPQTSRGLPAVEVFGPDANAIQVAAAVLARMEDRGSDPGSAWRYRTHEVGYGSGASSIAVSASRRCAKCGDDELESAVVVVNFTGVNEAGGAVNLVMGGLRRSLGRVVGYRATRLDGTWHCVLESAQRANSSSDAGG